MDGCSCTNSKTGKPKLRYPTRSAAEQDCEKLRKRWPDGETLNVYYCCDANCWHLGNSSVLDEFDEEWSDQPRRGTWSLADKYPEKQALGTDNLLPQRQPHLGKTAEADKSFFSQLMEDGQPTADAVRKTASRVIRSQAVQACGRIGYKGLVETLGVGLALSRSVPRTTKRLASAVWKAIEKAAEKNE